MMVSKSINQCIWG